MRHRSRPDHEAKRAAPQAMVAGLEADHEVALINEEGAILHPLC
jgi:hypothetical protein